MPIIRTIHAPYEWKLEAVKAEMAVLGAPVIRVIDCGQYFMALEGCHRIAAAHALEIEPKWIIYGPTDEIGITEFDWFEPHNWAGTSYPASDVAFELNSLAACTYVF